MAHVVGRRLMRRLFLRPEFSSSNLRLPYLSQLRLLSSSEAVSALRPFYFAVHPDLFVQHPDMRLVNEDSLKRLHGHLFAANKHYPGGRPLLLTFYLRQRPDIDSDPDEEFRMVQLNLNLHRGIYKTVVQILTECHLPISHLEHNKEPESSDSNRNSYGGGSKPHGWTEYDEEQLRVFWRRKNSDNEKERPSKGMKFWVEKFSEEASSREKTYSALKYEIDQEIETLQTQTGLSAVHWHSDWTLSHCRGSLFALKRVLGLKTRPGLGMIPALRGREVGFGNRGTYLGMDNCLHLGCDDVPEDWLKLIRHSSSPGVQNIFPEIIKWEQKLSTLLGGVTIRCSPETAALRHFTWVKSLTEKLTEAKFSPDIFTGPEVVIVVDSESDGYLLTDNGEIHIPVNCSPKRLGDFLNNNTPIAKSLKIQFQKTTELLEETKLSCLQHLQLGELTWDSWLAVEELQGCLSRLLDEYRGKDRAFFRHKKLHITSTENYSVSSDGKINIPMGWVNA